MREDAIFYAAAILEIAEYELFCNAWEEWYGVSPDRAVIEPDFGQFLDNGSVPHYVAGYVRNILSDETILSREKKAMVRTRIIYYAPLIVSFLVFMYFLLWK